MSEGTSFRGVGKSAGVKHDRKESAYSLSVGDWMKSFNLPRSAGVVSTNS